MVMDKGVAIEYDTPYALLCNTQSVFWGMCERSGDLDSIFEVAKSASEISVKLWKWKWKNEKKWKNEVKHFKRFYVPTSCCS